MKQRWENNSKISNLILEAIVMFQRDQSHFCSAPKVFAAKSISLSIDDSDVLKYLTDLVFRFSPLINMSV